MRGAAWRPEAIFLLFSLVGGLLLAALIAPVLGGNETFNFHRAIAVASGHVLIEPATVPAGIVRFLDAVWGNFPEGTKPPFSFTAEQYRGLAGIPLEAERPVLLQPNPIAVLHPFSYLPQVPLLWIGLKLGLPPLWLFYLGRLAGLVAGIALTFQAIRIMPVHKHALAALALLPTILFSRSTLDADQLTNGLAFLFLAMTMREIAAGGPIGRGRLAALAAAAFVLAQAKSAYLLLPFLVLAIPAARFGSARRKAASVALIVLPGLIGSLAWMIALKRSYFAGISYRTWAGDVDPGAQQAFILSDPIGYAEVLLRTVFGTSFIGDSLVGLIGVFGPPVMLPLVLMPFFAVALGGAALLGEDRGGEAAALKSGRTRSLAVLLFGGSALIVLTLLYLQWNSPAAPLIQGFQGRYLYPLLPLLLLLLPKAAPKQAQRFGASECLLFLGALSVASTVWMTWTTYLA